MHPVRNGLVNEEIVAKVTNSSLFQPPEKGKRAYSFSKGQYFALWFVDRAWTRLEKENNNQYVKIE